MQTEFIDKLEKILPSQDYALLRQKGIEYITELGQAIWTDHNTHDPGITILELLCYALSDLGYRTAFPIKDILAEINNDEPEKLSSFFTARNILTCNPVTLNDFRRLLIDIPGVKNAWLRLVEKPDPQLYIHCDQKRLTLEEDKEAKQEEIDIQGLYDIQLEFEEDVLLGEFNQTKYRMNVISANREFSLEIYLPSWDKFVTKVASISAFQFAEFPLAADANSYIRSAPLLYQKKGSLTFQDSGETYKVVSSSRFSTTAITTAIHEALGGALDLLDHYHKSMVKIASIFESVKQICHEHRNLCEDFNRISGLDLEEIGVCADIEVTSDADLEDVLAHVYFEINRFLAPRVNFYTIKELVQSGYTTEQIFDGPKLIHGFITEDELEKSVFHKVIHVSDIIQMIMDIPGVLAVKKIVLSSFYHGEIKQSGESWCLPIGDFHATRLSIERCKMTFFKGLIPYFAREDETLDRYSELLSLERYNRLAAREYDLAIPYGENRHLTSYYSIQHELPETYGIGEAGLPRSVSPLRKAQARQLKAYLLFFDQILANYLSQLGHVRELFSLDPTIAKTYFSQALYPIPDVSDGNVPNIGTLLLEFVQSLDLEQPNIDLDDPASFRSQWQAFLQEKKTQFSEAYKKLDPLIEDEKTYHRRKNGLLDHLLARFAEKFTDYVLLMYTLDQKRAPAELIRDKLKFLQDYPEISSGRGKAFNYKQEKTWDTENVSGLQKRVARLLGIESFARRTLSYCNVEIFPHPDPAHAGKYLFRIFDEYKHDLLFSKKKYNSKEKAQEAVEAALQAVLEKARWHVKKDFDKRYSLFVNDEHGAKFLIGDKKYETKQDAENAVTLLLEYFRKNTMCEGFFLVEHLLIRPRSIGDDLLKICVRNDCSECSGFLDPYSFRITVVIPGWPERFKNFDFRLFFESTIRLEAPAHVHVKICWVDRPSMLKFEEVYRPWLDALANEPFDQSDLTNKQNDLLAVLDTLKSIYPETHLHDCREDAGERPILLNKSTLGTIS
ncbi:hypothetical protein EH223_00220 [candidate division KSB1 bacterium]|nr:hypothetical protein [candidate division KSB1 bacterium]RQW07345.1 MAG: hypothetical protein EH223_00220 [candidate division KSB1 bacterium]